MVGIWEQVSMQYAMFFLIIQMIAPGNVVQNLMVSVVTSVYIWTLPQVNFDNGHK